MLLDEAEALLPESDCANNFPQFLSKCILKIMKLIRELHCVLAVTGTSTNYYCHFDEYLQSVCLKKTLGHPSGQEFWHVYRNEVFFWSDKPRQPVYNSTRCRIEERERGIWSFPRELSLPWPVDYDNITYVKAGWRGPPKYYDVKFTPHSSPRRFNKLTPKPINNMKDDAKRTLHANRNLTFSSDYKHHFEAQIRDPISRARNKAFISIMLYSKTSPRIIIKEFHALADCDSPEFELARDTKAFIFELPTAEPQYGVIFEFGSLSSMLYRVDQVSLRGHDNLPHLFSRVRRPAILQSRGRGRRRAILQSHRRNANDPPLYEEVSRSPNEAAQPPSYDEALRWLEMGAPPSYGSLNVDAPNP